MVSGTSDPEFSTAPGLSRARQAGEAGAAPGLGFLSPLRLPRVPAAPRSSYQQGIPWPPVSHWEWSSTGQVKSSPRVDGPQGQSSSLPAQRLHPKLLCSSPWLAQGQARNNTKPPLQEPRPGQTWLFWLSKDRGTSPSLTQLSTALGGVGRQSKEPRDQIPMVSAPSLCNSNFPQAATQPLHLSGDPAVHIHFRLKLLVIC